MEHVGVHASLDRLLLVVVKTWLHRLLNPLNIGMHLIAHAARSAHCAVEGPRLNRILNIALLSDVQVLVLGCARETAEPSFLLLGLILLFLLLKILLLLQRLHLVVLLELVKLVLINAVVVLHALHLLGRLLVFSVHQWLPVSLHRLEFLSIK